MGKKEKKEKKIKKKVILSKPETYSKKFSYLYNNKLLSDMTIKFEKSGNVVFCHKIILTSTSEYFETLFESGMQESKSNEIIIPEDENEDLFKEFIQFLYSGKVDCSNEQHLVEFLIVANKYLVKNIKDFKVSAKILLNGVIGIFILLYSKTTLIKILRIELESLIIYVKVLNSRN
jgi:hypothetical protein